jgi:hypothetical protein
VQRASDDLAAFVTGTYGLRFAAPRVQILTDADFAAAALATTGALPAGDEVNAMSSRPASTTYLPLA